MKITVTTSIFKISSLQIHPNNGLETTEQECNNHSLEMDSFSISGESLYSKKRAKEENDRVARILRP